MFVSNMLPHRLVVLLFPMLLLLSASFLFASEESDSAQPISIRFKKTAESEVDVFSLRATHDLSNRRKSIFFDLPVKEGTTPYTMHLERLPGTAGAGFKVMLRSGVEGSQSLENYERTKLIDEISFFLNGNKAIAICKEEGKVAEDGISLGVYAPRKNALDYFNQQGESVLTVDLMKAADFFLQRREFAASGGASSQHFSTGGMADEIKKMFLGQMLVSVPEEEAFGVKGAELIMPTKGFAMRLALPVITVKTPFASKKPDAQSNVALLSRHGALPEEGYFTKPIFIEGGGGSVAAYRNSALVRGRVYFLHVHLVDRSLVIDLRCLGDSSYVTNLLSPPQEINDAIRLTISGDDNTATIARGNGSVFAQSKSSGLSLLSQGSLSRRVAYLDVIQALNILSQWRSGLGESGREESFDSLADVDLLGLIKAGGQVTKPDAHIALDSHVMAYPMTVGFSGLAGRNNLTTSLRVHPTNPAAGIAVGPVWIANASGRQAPYVFVFKTLSRRSYSVSLFALGSNALDGFSESLDTLVFGIEPPSLASMVVASEAERHVVSIKDGSGVERLRKVLKVDNKENYVQAHLRLVPDPDFGKATLLPGVGAVMNVLSHMIEGGAVNVDTVLDDAHMRAMFTPQRGSSCVDGYLFAGCYRSDVPRCYDTIAPYRANWLVRHAVWAGKKVFRTLVLPAEIWDRHKVAGTIIVGSVVTAYLNPEQTAQYYSQLSEWLYSLDNATGISSEIGSILSGNSWYQGGEPEAYINQSLDNSK